MLTRLEEQDSSEVEVNFLYQACKFECIEAGGSNPPSLANFIDNVKSIFPNAQKCRVKTANKNITVYRGLHLKALVDDSNIAFSQVLQLKPGEFVLRSSNDNEVVFELDSGCKSNGNIVFVELSLNSNGNFDITIGGKKVDLGRIGIEPKYKLTKTDVLNVFKIAERLTLCNGVKMTQSVTVSRFHTLDKWTAHGKTCRSLRSLNCLKVVAFNAKSETCRVCQKMTFKDDKENICQDTSKENQKLTKSCPTMKDIEKVFPNAPKEMVELLLEQAKNVNRHPKGRRWSKKFIATSLQLFTRSPKCYEMLVESKMLLLPSKSLLIMYKNSIKQEPGFDETVFEWMREESNRLGMKDCERVGGIIFDEMSVQEDIQIEKSGNVLELSGFTDLGEEGDCCSQLKKGSRDKGIGTHVLQLLFLGFNGFRFPFAHFVTNNIQASELFSLFWKAIYLLYTFGFEVMYTCMDGAQANRTFMHVCVDSHVDTYIAPSPCTPYPIVFMMDISHVLKKIRNNILKSGIQKHCTRLLTLPNKTTIHWQMFTDYYHWDKQNGLQLHKKLTNDHIFLDSQLKMRNHLAEHVLNSEMLNGFKIYKENLGDKGSVLNGLIELLEQTSELIQIFRDMRPIKSKSDPRLLKLRSIDQWFTLWETTVAGNEALSQKEKAKCLFSYQCHEDIHACIRGFISLCVNVQDKGTSVAVTPALTNSDVIENIFNQQRSTYNGANSNPSAVQYKKTINSIILGQSSVSRKSNAGRPASAVPFALEMKAPAKKRKFEGPASCSKIKVIRM